MSRILRMMQVVAANKEKNLMGPSAVAACMAPLLLRPLLAGECDIDNDFDVGGDTSALLLQAAAAANHAQAIVITLLEEYKKIFMVFSNDVGVFILSFILARELGHNYCCFQLYILLCSRRKVPFLLMNYMRTAKMMKLMVRRQAMMMTILMMMRMTEKKNREKKTKKKTMMM